MPALVYGVWESKLKLMLVEIQGIITEIGSGISLLKVGDRVVMPFNVSRRFPPFF